MYCRKFVTSASNVTQNAGSTLFLKIMQCIALSHVFSSITLYVFAIKLFLQSKHLTNQVSPISTSLYFLHIHKAQFRRHLFLVKNFIAKLLIQGYIPFTSGTGKQPLFEIHSLLCFNNLTPK